MPVDKATDKAIGEIKREKKPFIPKPFRDTGEDDLMGESIEETVLTTIMKTPEETEKMMTNMKKGFLTSLDNANMIDNIIEKHIRTFKKKQA